jgi:hypothetical protein
LVWLDQNHQRHQCPQMLHLIGCPASSCSMCHCLLAPLVDMPVDITLSTSRAEATTIVPIKGSMPLLQLWHLTTSLCWWACSTITNRQWLWYVTCCSIWSNHLSQPWHLSFSMMTTTLAWKQDKQVVISGVGSSCWYMLEGGPWGYEAEPMRGWQARHSNWNKSHFWKNWIYHCRVNKGTINVEMSQNIRIHMMLSFEWDMLEFIP